LNDRVQEAAYSLIPENVRAETHLRIGNLLASRISPEQEEAVFEIVNQLNRGSNLITSVEERKRLAALNIMAGTGQEIDSVCFGAFVSQRCPGNAR
jgi:predicted ATPase